MKLTMRLSLNLVVFLLKIVGILFPPSLIFSKRSGKNIAILDTTINHFPEVFEYQYEPDVWGHNFFHKNEYILAGSSCLAGDVIGTYHFREKIKVGSKIVIKRIGSYSLAKAHTFNGINLPDIYCLDDRFGLKKIKTFTFEEYSKKFGA